MIKSFVRSVGMLAAVAASCVAFVGANAIASPVSGNSQNNSVTFDPSTPTDVVVSFSDTKIMSGRYIQVGFRDNAAAFSILSIEYSYDSGSSWSSYTPSYGTPGVAPAYIYGSVLDLGANPGVDTVLFRYTLPSGIENGKLIQMNFLSNNNGDTDGGVIKDVFGNDYTDLTRDHTSIAAPPPVPEPTTFAIASIGLGLAGALRMRKRAQKA